MVYKIGPTFYAARYNSFERRLGLWYLMPLLTIYQWPSVLLVEETRVPREIHWPAASHWQCCIKYTSPWVGLKLTTLVVITTDCKSNYHMITTTTAPLWKELSPVMWNKSNMQACLRMVCNWVPPIWRMPYSLHVKDNSLQLLMSNNMYWVIVDRLLQGKNVLSLPSFPFS